MVRSVTDKNALSRRSERCTAGDVEKVESGHMQVVYNGEGHLVSSYAAAHTRHELRLATYEMSTVTINWTIGVER